MKKINDLKHMQLHITCVQATDQILRTTGSREQRCKKKEGRERERPPWKTFISPLTRPTAQGYDTPFQGITKALISVQSTWYKPLWVQTISPNPVYTAC